jgi:hypothetical protein
MEPQGSLPYSQEPINYLYPDKHKSCPHTLMSLQSFSVLLLIYLKIFQVVISGFLIKTLYSCVTSHASYMPAHPTLLNDAYIWKKL